MGYEGSGRSYRDYGDGRYGRSRTDFDRDRDYRERGYGGPRDYEDDRGFFDRAGDEVRSWFGDEEAERRRRWDERVRQREYGRGYDAEGYGDRGDRGRPDRDYDDRDRYAARERGGGLGGGTYGHYAGRSGYGESYGVGRGAGATSTYGLGAGSRHDDWGLDPNYSAWRRRQVEALDRDYHDYQRENQSRFESDFGGWRTRRQGQRQLLQKVEEHQEVVGSDGSHVGTVDHVRGDLILLTKSDRSAGGHHHSIPCSWVETVDDKVHINRTAAQALQAWKDEEQSEGPHYLNRAFAGTY